MLHLRDDFLDFVTYFSHQLRGWLANISERRALVRVHGHAVLDVHPKLCHFASDLVHMMIVDSRYDDGVHLATMPWAFSAYVSSCLASNSFAAPMPRQITLPSRTQL
jgi:hypothetical protein